MPQQFADYPYNAELFARALESFARDVGQGINRAMEMKLQERKARGEGVDTFRVFMAIPAEKRKELLQNPAFRRIILEAMDPHIFSKHKVGKEGLAPTEADVLKLGEETSQEKLEAAIRGVQFAGEQSKASAEATKARMEQYKEAIAKGDIKPTPMNMLMAGGVTNPLAAAQFSLIPEKELREISELSQNTGPLQEKKEVQDWFHKLIEQGMQSGTAMRNAIAISKGEWDKVDKNIRGKVEQELAISAGNLAARRQEIQANIANSKATMTMHIAETLGTTVADAQPIMEALRKGEQPPIDSTILQQLKNFELVGKQQEQEKNRQAILTDQAGLNQIRDALSEMAKAYNSSYSYISAGGNSAKIAGQMVKLQDEYAKRLASRYGIDLKADPGFMDSVKDAMSVAYFAEKTGRGMAEKAGESMTRYGVAMGKDAWQGFDALMEKQLGNVGAAAEAVKKIGPMSVMPGVPASMQNLTTPIEKGKFTPEQESMLSGVLKSIQSALMDANVPEAQKESYRKYLYETVIPITQDPRLFMNLFVRPQQ